MTRTLSAAFTVYSFFGSPISAFVPCPHGTSSGRVPVGVLQTEAVTVLGQHQKFCVTNYHKYPVAGSSRTRVPPSHYRGGLRDTLFYRCDAASRRGYHGGILSMSQSQSPVNGQGQQQQLPDPYEVVFVRHGQSTWNKANRFIGWTDTELTEEGEIEARVAGQVLLAEGFEFDVVYTSMLKRAIKTAWVVLDELSQQHVPVIMDWRLNERCYGALVGREKKECVRQYGAQQLKTWRRSYDVAPPPIDPSSKLWPGNNPRYNFLMEDGESLVPLHESLKDVMKRSSFYWDEVIVPSIRKGKRVCVCGHENNLRSLLKHLDGISDEDIMNVELPRAVPLVYRLDHNLRPIRMERAAPYLSGEYAGDPEEIAAIMDRDRKNVYDLSIAQNLEESETRFAAKIEDVVQPCDVEDMLDLVDPSVGTFLETGVGEDACRESPITSTPLLLYNRGQAKKRKQKSGEQKNPVTSPQAAAPIVPDDDSTGMETTAPFPLQEKDEHAFSGKPFVEETSPVATKLK